MADSRKPFRQLMNPAYDTVRDPLAYINELGKQIAISGICGVDTEAQGKMIAWECLAARQSIITVARRHHFIHGRMSMKAECMLGDFRTKLGGKHTVLERSSNRAAIRLELRGQVEEFSLTWEEAQREPFVYEGKEKDVVKALADGKKPPIKAKYQTPRSRMQMLWARVVSDGVHCVAPEITTGIYTPEEISDFGELQDAERRQPTEIVVVDAEVVETPATTAPATNPVATTSAPVVEQPPFAADGDCTAEQVNQLLELFVELGVSHETQQQTMAKYNVRAWRSLKADVIAGIIAKLVAKKAARETSRAPEPGTSLPNNGPCTQEQIDRAKQLGAQYAQVAGDPDVFKKIKEFLSSKSLNGLSDLTVTECDQLIHWLTIQQLEKFFELSILGHAKAAAGN